MPKRAELRAAVRKTTRRLPPQWRTRARDLALRNRLGSRALVGARPVVSVIVPVYNVASYLDECLQSLRRQSLSSLEIILVDDGSTDESPQICARHAAADRRIRVHRQPNAGLGAARNAGIRLATGRYLTFLDSDDTLPRNAYAQMARTLNTTGSDFAIGAVRRVSRGKFSAPGWVNLVHAYDRLGIRVDDFPEAVRDVIACNRMFRRSFWNRIGLSFPEGVAYEDHAPMMTAFVRARAFDLLKAVTYYWRIREDQTSIGQQKHELSNLRDRLAAKEAAWGELERHGSDAVRVAWLHRVLDMDLNLFVDQVPEVDEQYWQMLSKGVRRYLSMAPPQLLAGLRVDRRLKLWLVAHGRREQVCAVLDAQRFEGSQLRTEVVDGHLYARLPYYDDPDEAIPREVYEVGPEQAALITSLRAGRWVSPTAYELDLWAYIRYLDMAELRPNLRAWLVCTTVAPAPSSAAEQPVADAGIDAGDVDTTAEGGPTEAAALAAGVPVVVAGPAAAEPADPSDPAGHAGPPGADVAVELTDADSAQGPDQTDDLSEHPEPGQTPEAGETGSSADVREQPTPEPVRIELPVRMSRDPAATRWSRLLYQDSSRAAATVTVDAEALIAAQQADPAAAGTQSRWRLELELSVAGMTRTGVIAHRDGQGSAAVLATAVVGQHRLIPQFDDKHGVQISVHRATFELASASVEGRRVHARLVPTAPIDAATPEAAPLAGFNRVLAVGGPYRQRASASLQHDADGSASFELSLPRIAPNRHAPNTYTWSMELAGPHGRRARIPWPAADSAHDGSEWLAGSTELRVHRTSGRNIEVREVSVYPTVDGIAIEPGQPEQPDRIVVDGVWAGDAPAGYTVRLQHHRVTLAPVLAELDEVSYHAEFALEADEWGFGSGPLPSGKYRLQVSYPGVGGTEAIAPRVSDAATGGLPLEVCTGDARYRCVRDALGYLTFEVGPPLTDDELGNYAQAQLRDHYANDPAEIEPGAVLFQCYRGETATDSQLALCNELAQRDPDRRLYWGVADRSVAIPLGSTALVIGSTEYYRKLATVEYLCNNIDFDRFFAKKPYQRFLQTFHGYPFKSMGLSFWHGKGFSAAQITHEIERRRAAWDVILTPMPAMNQYYRQEYRYTGPIIDTGYPRDDVLVADAAQIEMIRKQTRTLLGIDDGQTAVMYAPTWRDDQATGAWSAKLVSYLDLQQASDALGENYVLLLRGHNYVARMPSRAPRSARVLDVTDYPEINDLILASDVAVLDYSSLRFDYALTGKPMIFLVPDLDSYGGKGRGFLFDYEDTAPGPLCADSAEVLAALSDLQAIRTGYSARYQAFNDKYNVNHDGGATARAADAFFGAQG